MDLNCENVFKIVSYVVIGYVFLRILQDNCDIGLSSFFRSVEGFTGNSSASGNALGSVLASENIGHNSGPQAVQGLGRTPSTCYPQPALQAKDLLPKEDSAAIQEFNIAKPAGEGILQGVNMLDAGFHVGINSVGQSLRNANQQLRAEPPNPQVQVSPWQMSSIGPDLLRRPLEDGGCDAPSQSGEPTGVEA